MEPFIYSYLYHLATALHGRLNSIAYCSGSSDPKDLDKLINQQKMVSAFVIKIIIHNMYYNFVTVHISMPVNKLGNITTHAQHHIYCDCKNNIN